jgi:hypothetical protein
MTDLELKKNVQTHAEKKDYSFEILISKSKKEV